MFRALRERAAQLELLADISRAIGYFVAEQALREKAREVTQEADQLATMLSGWRGPAISS